MSAVMKQCPACNGTKQYSSMGYIIKRCLTCNGIGLIPDKSGFSVAVKDEITSKNHLADVEAKANGEIVSGRAHGESEQSQGREVGEEKARPRRGRPKKTAAA